MRGMTVHMPDLIRLYVDELKARETPNTSPAGKLLHEKLMVYGDGSVGGWEQAFEQQRLNIMQALRHMSRP